MGPGPGPRGWATGTEEEGKDPGVAAEGGPLPLSGLTVVLLLLLLLLVLLLLRVEPLAHWAAAALFSA